MCIYYLLELVTKPPNIQEENLKEKATSEMKSHIKKDIPYQSISVNKEIPYPISIPQHIKLIEKIPSQTENKKVIPKNPRNNIENISSNSTDKAKELAIYQLLSEFYWGADPYEISLNQMLLSEFQESMKYQKNRKPREYKNGKPFSMIVGEKNKASYKFGDPIAPSKARHIWIASSYGRSGSSFLGECLNHYPGSFYSYEPEALISKRRYGNPLYGGLHNIADDVFKCQPGRNYFEFERNGVNSKVPIWSHIRANTRFWNIYEALTPDFESTYGVKNMMSMYHAICPLFPIHLTKTALFPINETEILLQDSVLSRTLKLIILFRDPRGILNSLINSVDWDMGNKNNMVDKMCQKMKSDALAAAKLKMNYPGSYSRGSMDI